MHLRLRASASMLALVMNTNVPSTSAPAGLLSEVTRQLVQATDKPARGLVGPWPAPGLQGWREKRAPHSAPHGQDLCAERLLQLPCGLLAGRGQGSLGRIRTNS